MTNLTDLADARRRIHHRNGQRYRHVLGECIPDPRLETREFVFGWHQARCWELASKICHEGIGDVTRETGELIQW